MKLISIEWKISTYLSTLKNLTNKTSNKIFKIVQNPGIYTNLSISQDYRYIPYILEPTTIYNQRIINILKSKGYIVKQTKFPIMIKHKDLKYDMNITITGIRIYPPCILLITFKISFLSDKEMSTEELIDIQEIQEDKLFHRLLQETILLVDTFNVKNIAKKEYNYISRPALKILCSKDELSSSSITNILARNRHNSVADELKKQILLKNAHHNVKSDKEFLLVDKTGIVYAVESKQDLVYKIHKIHNILELNIVHSLFLEHFDSSDIKNKGFNFFILNMIKEWLNEQKIIFKKSVSHQKILILIQEELSLSIQFDKKLEKNNNKIILDMAKPIIDNMPVENIDYYYLSFSKLDLTLHKKIVSGLKKLQKLKGTSILTDNVKFIITIMISLSILILTVIRLQS